MTQPLSPFARRTLPLIDLTNVEDGCTSADVRALCEKARGLPVAVAAACLRPDFVLMARDMLVNSGIRVATVINFPDAQVTPEMSGANLDSEALARRTELAVEDGADEIDLVFAWKSFLNGQTREAQHVVEAVKAACGPARLKVILESGVYTELHTLRAACDAVIDAGADFLKTSTTRVSPAATPEAARVLCEASKAAGGIVGVKVSGGVRNAEQARMYIDLVADIMGLNWIEPDHFRIGASKLVDNLLNPVEDPLQAVGY